MKPLVYKGYIADIDLDEESKFFFGSVVNTTDVITFKATNAKDLIEEFHTSVDDYIDFCEEKGLDPEKPYNGKILVRTSSSVHKELAHIAAIEKKGMNDIAVEAISSYIKKKIA